MAYWIPGNVRDVSRASSSAPVRSTHGTAVVNQVGGSRERVDVIVTQVVTVSLEHMLPLLQRVPVIPGLAQRGRKLFRCREPLGVLPAAGHLERVRDVTRYVQRFLVLAEASQVTRHRVVGEESLRVARSRTSRRSS